MASHLRKKGFQTLHTARKVAKDPGHQLAAVKNLFKVFSGHSER